MLEFPKAYAVTIGPDIFTPAKNFNTFAALINTIIPNVLIISGIVFLIMLISAGYQLIIAGQVDPQKWEKTRQTLTNAVIGLIIIVIAYWIVRIIQTVTGVNITNPDL